RIQPNGLTERKKLFGRLWEAFGHAATMPAKLDPATDDILEEGEEGPAVKELQQRLRALGYPVGEPNGVYGERTQAAVAAFQMREKLAGEPGKWRIAEYGQRLAAAVAPAEAAPGQPAAVPFEDAGRQQVTAKELAAKGDGLVSVLAW